MFNNPTVLGIVFLLTVIGIGWYLHKFKKRPKYEGAVQANLKNKENQALVSVNPEAKTGDGTRGLAAALNVTGPHANQERIFSKAKKSLTQSTSSKKLPAKELDLGIGSSTTPAGSGRKGTRNSPAKPGSLKSQIASSEAELGFSSQSASNAIKSNYAKALHNQHAPTVTTKVAVKAKPAKSSVTPPTAADNISKNNSAKVSGATISNLRTQGTNVSSEATRTANSTGPVPIIVPPKSRQQKESVNPFKERAEKMASQQEKFKVNAGSAMHIDAKESVHAANVYMGSNQNSGLNVAGVPVQPTSLKTADKSPSKIMQLMHTLKTGSNEPAKHQVVKDSQTSLPLVPGVNEPTSTSAGRKPSTASGTTTGVTSGIGAVATAGTGTGTTAGVTTGTTSTRSSGFTSGSNLVNTKTSPQNPTSLESKLAQANAVDFIGEVQVDFDDQFDEVEKFVPRLTRAEEITAPEDSLDKYHQEQANQKFLNLAFQKDPNLELSLPKQQSLEKARRARAQATKEILELGKQKKEAELAKRERNQAGDKHQQVQQVKSASQIIADNLGVSGVKIPQAPGKNADLSKVITKVLQDQDPEVQKQRQQEAELHDILFPKRKVNSNAKPRQYPEPELPPTTQRVVNPSAELNAESKISQEVKVGKGQNPEQKPEQKPGQNPAYSSTPTKTSSRTTPTTSVTRASTTGTSVTGTSAPTTTPNPTRLESNPHAKVQQAETTKVGKTVPARAMGENSSAQSSAPADLTEAKLKELISASNLDQQAKDTLITNLQNLGLQATLQQLIQAQLQAAKIKAVISNQVQAVVQAKASASHYASPSASHSVPTQVQVQVQGQVQLQEQVKLDPNAQALAELESSALYQAQPEAIQGILRRFFMRSFREILVFKITPHRGELTFKTIYSVITKADGMFGFSPKSHTIVIGKFSNLYGKPKQTYGWLYSDLGTLDKEYSYGETSNQTYNNLYLIMRKSYFSEEYRSELENIIVHLSLFLTRINAAMSIDDIRIDRKFLSSSVDGVIQDMQKIIANLPD